MGLEKDALDTASDAALAAQGGVNTVMNKLSSALYRFVVGLSNSPDTVGTFAGKMSMDETRGEMKDATINAALNLGNDLTSAEAWKNDLKELTTPDGIADATVMTLETLTGYKSLRIIDEIGDFNVTTHRSNVDIKPSTAAGLDKSQAAILKEKLLKIPNVNDVKVFGSRVKKTHKADSDLDVLLEGPESKVDLLKLDALKPVREAQSYAKSQGIPKLDLNVGKAEDWKKISKDAENYDASKGPMVIKDLK